MNETALIAAAVLALGYALASKRLENSILTGPLIFLCLGGVLSQTGILHIEQAEESLHLLAEITLIIVLFADATQVRARDLLQYHTWPIRMLVIGLPLAMLLGTGLNAILLPGWGLWEIALLAAVLAPTDAALGQAVVTNAHVPQRIRRALTVESGLNDGLALPAVLMLGCLAVGGQHEFTQVSWLQFAIEQIGVGALAGIVVGYVGGKLFALAKAHDYCQTPMQGIAILAVAGLTYLAAQSLGGNGFLAAFVGGVAFAAAQTEDLTYPAEFMETEGTLLVLLTFLLVGFVLAPEVVSHADPIWILLALGSLFIVRPLAIWLSLIGTDAPPATRLFMGWFGPRGLATILFALLIVSQLTHLKHGHEILMIATLTVLLSAFLHGTSAAPSATKFGARLLPKNLE
jgi:NhaP-type Na+/H+ or K+/H+ antiporter